MAQGVAIAGAMAGAFGAFVLKTTESVDALGKLSKETSISTDKLQEMELQAKINGSSAEAMKSSIQGLTQKIGEASQKGSEDFARLGISVRDTNGNVKNASQVMDELDGSFKRLGLSTQEQQDFLGKLGIDKTMIHLITSANGGLTELQRNVLKLGKVTEKQVKDSEDLQDSFTTMTHGLEGLQRQIAVGSAPAMTELLNSFSEFLVVNQDVIKDGIGKFIEVLGAVIGAVFNVVSGIVELISNSQVLQIGLGALTVGIMAMNKAFLFNPIGLIIASVTALILLIDDLIVGFNGGESAVQDFFKSFFDADIIGGIKAVFKMVDDFVGSIGRIISGDFSIGEIFNGKDEEKAPIQNINKQETAQQLKFNDAGNARPAPVANSNTNNINIEIKTDDPNTAGASVESSVNKAVNEAGANFGVGGS